MGVYVSYYPLKQGGFQSFFRPQMLRLEVGVSAYAGFGFRRVLGQEPCL
jgi:hypothetical protein